jgi:hypothetical protein
VVVCAHGYAGRRAKAREEGIRPKIGHLQLGCHGPCDPNSSLRFDPVKLKKMKITVQAQSRIVSTFIYTVGGLLLITGVAKLLSGLGHSRVLQVADPILSVPFRFALAGAAVAELTVAWVCFFVPRPAMQAAAIAWLATDFLCYRIGLWAVGWTHPCHCMGTLAGAIHLSDVAADRLMRAILCYMLLGSYLILLVHYCTRTSTALGPRHAHTLIGSATIPVLGSSKDIR